MESNVMLTLVFFLTGSLASWYLSSLRERRKASVQISGLETKAQSFQNRIKELREDLLRSQAEAVTLQKSLYQERENQMKVLHELRGNFQKYAVFTGGVCLVFGLSFGGILAGVLTASHIRTGQAKQMLRLEVEARLAEGKAEWWKDQAEEMKIENERLQEQFFVILEQKAVALAKLDMILDHLVPGRGGRYFLDIAKMNQGVQEPAKQQAGPETPLPTLPKPGSTR